jgi:Ca2+-binding EF-hand superfamily protein
MWHRQELLAGLMNLSKSTAMLPRHALLLLSLSLGSSLSPLVAQEPAKEKPEQEKEKTDSKLQRYFRVCDLDDSKWISFREALATLGLSKSEFRALDDDHDGCFTLAEFGKHKQQVLSLLGSFPEEEDKDKDKPASNPKPKTKQPKQAKPAPKTVSSSKDAPKGAAGLLELLKGASSDAANSPTNTSPKPTAPKPRIKAIAYPSPTELLSLVDSDKSGGLSRKEIKALLLSMEAKLSADVIVDRTDRNQSNELEAAELGPFAFIISRRLPPGGLLGLQKSKATEAEVLKWESKRGDLSKPLNGLTEARQFSHFSRLDSDGDGKIDSVDLRHKLTQAHTSVRASAIVSALDLDGNGSIDPKEFLLAVRGRN